MDETFYLIEIDETFYIERGHIIKAYIRGIYPSFKTAAMSWDEMINKLIESQKDSHEFKIKINKKGTKVFKAELAWNNHYKTYYIQPAYKPILIDNDEVITK